MKLMLKPTKKDLKKLAKRLAKALLEEENAILDRALHDVQPRPTPPAPLVLDKAGFLGRSEADHADLPPMGYPRVLSAFSPATKEPVILPVADEDAEIEALRHLMIPDDFKPFTVIMQFNTDDGSVSGSMEIHVWSADLADALLTGQRIVYMNLTKTCGIDPEGLEVFADFVLSGHHRTVWPRLNDPFHDRDNPDPEDVTPYDQSQDPFFTGSGSEGEGD